MYCGCLGLFGLEGGFQGLHGVLVVFSTVYNLHFLICLESPARTLWLTLEFDRV